ncbi:hypothetical protein B0A52_05072 [Exophiala mesophila]|uniref:Alpha/beta hydrolase fold-3 domain-containing protein n=1 Tax=Exophiala mesophila TaxID=212818 RepID=A0A438N6Z1_EXOME|nr:hypothetical protein B0A52_05072 [Exophiala mesophila]
MVRTLDPEYAAALGPTLAAMRAAPKAPVYEVAPRRTGINTMWAAYMSKYPTVTDVEETIIKVPGHEGVEIAVHHFIKKNTPPSASAVLYTHGGGYFCLSVPLYSKVIQTYVSTSGVQFFAVEYRFPPEYVFPTPVEDCYAALEWLNRNAGQFGIDPARLAIMGDSAGGGLAAATAIIARDRNLSPPLAKQIIIYGMLDDRNQSRFEELQGLASWQPDDNLTGWAAYIGKDNAAKPGVSPYAAPARVETVVGLPRLYCDVPDLDIFRDENIAYAARHALAGIPIELHVYPSLPHGFEPSAPYITATRLAMSNRVRVIMAL